jgi:hypothetical protein
VQSSACKKLSIDKIVGKIGGTFFMELWYTEFQTKNLGLTARIKETLFTGQSEFQEVAVVDTVEFGRMLVLDGVFQTSIFDEYIYHEMIAHVPLYTHPNPKNVLVIGGGDGGSVREVVRHNSVESVEMVEIDGLVVEVSKKYLPEISAALIDNNPKVHLHIGDGIKHMAESEDKYDGLGPNADVPDTNNANTSTTSIVSFHCLVISIVKSSDLNDRLYGCRDLMLPAMFIELPIVNIHLSSDEIVSHGIDSVNKPWNAGRIRSRHPYRRVVRSHRISFTQIGAHVKITVTFVEIMDKY